MDDQTVSIQDNELVSYDVQCESREIRLHTANRATGAKTDIVFLGVVCYKFANDFGHNILFGVERVSAIDVFRPNMGDFKDGPYSGPGEWASSLETALRFFEESGVFGYWLDATEGMSGWVLARSMQKIVVDQGYDGTWMG